MGTCSSPDLAGGSKDQSGSTWLPAFCFSLSLLPTPHWHRMLPSHFTARTVNIKEHGKPSWCFQISRKSPEGGKTVHKGHVAPMLAFPDVSGGVIHAPQDRSVAPAATRRCACPKFNWIQNTNAHINGEKSIKHKATLASEAWS